MSRSLCVKHLLSWDLSCVNQNAVPPMEEGSWEEDYFRHEYFLCLVCILKGDFPQGRTPRAIRKNSFPAFGDFIAWSNHSNQIRSNHLVLTTVHKTSPLFCYVMLCLPCKNTSWDKWIDVLTIDCIGKMDSQQQNKQKTKLKATPSWNVMKDSWALAIGW